MFWKFEWIEKGSQTKNPVISSSGKANVFELDFDPEGAIKSNGLEIHI
jgi:hypothetical protein